MNVRHAYCAVIGTASSAGGTAVSALTTNDILTTISLILTIVGAVISLIVIPLLNWYRKAKADGKIDKDEIAEGVKTLGEGVSQIGEVIHISKEKED